MYYWMYLFESYISLRILENHTSWLVCGVYDNSINRNWKKLKKIVIKYQHVLNEKWKITALKLPSFNFIATNGNMISKYSRKILKPQSNIVICGIYMVLAPHTQHPDIHISTESDI